MAIENYYPFFNNTLDLLFDKTDKIKKLNFRMYTNFVLFLNTGTIIVGKRQI